MINDGSTDKSLEILQKYANEYPEIVLFNQENKGVSAARNVGIQNAKGRFVQFVDSDDYLPFNTYCFLISVVDGHAQIRNYDIVAGSMLYQAKTGNMLLSQLALSFKVNEFCAYECKSADYLLKAAVNEYVFLSSSSFLFRTDFLRKHYLLYDENLRVSEDNVFLLDVFNIDKNAYVLELPVPLYCYQYNEKSITRLANQDSYILNKLREIRKSCMAIVARKHKFNNSIIENTIRNVLIRNYNFAGEIYESLSEAYKAEGKALLPDGMVEIWTENGLVL